MSRILGPLRLVVLEPPCETLAQPSAQAFFIQGLLLKLRSYQDVYASGVLPLDTYDFISTLFLMGFQRGEDFQPLMVFRTTTYDRCLFHRLPFPGIAVMKGAGAEGHARLLQEKLDRCHASGEKISYGSGWAIAPELRRDRELREQMKDLMTAMLVHHEAEQGADLYLACGVLKVKTDQYFYDVGYHRFAGADGQPLPPVGQASLIGSEVVLLEAERFNGKALALAEKHRNIWTNRRSIAPLEFPSVARKAA